MFCVLQGGGRLAGENKVKSEDHMTSMIADQHRLTGNAIITQGENLGYRARHSAYIHQ